MTAQSLSEVLAALREREPIFHRPEHGTRRADFERMTDAAFWEVGASGRCHSRDFVLDELERRRTHPMPDAWSTSDFRCRELAPGVYLLTYHLVQGERETRRATLWQRANDGNWQAVYHQGTAITEAETSE
jgi:hypothetical protein